MKPQSHVALMVLSLFLGSFDATQAGEPPARHSLETDYGFMIGRWTCHVTQTGTPDHDVNVEYEWSFDRRVLRETMQLGPKLIGEFLTTYDKATDQFKGVGAVSRSEFERVSDTHYIVHDFDVGPAASIGAATDTEDCNKVK
jgi:hypothetical protein